MGQIMVRAEHLCLRDETVPQFWLWFWCCCAPGGADGSPSHNQKNHRGVFRERLETHVDAESSWKENKKHDVARVLRCQDGTAGEPM